MYGVVWRHTDTRKETKTDTDTEISIHTGKFVRGYQTRKLGTNPIEIVEYFCHATKSILSRKGSSFKHM